MFFTIESKIEIDKAEASLRGLFDLFKNPFPTFIYESLDEFIISSIITRYEEVIMRLRLKKGAISGKIRQVDLGKSVETVLGQFDRPIDTLVEIFGLRTGRFFSEIAASGALQLNIGPTGTISENPAIRKLVTINPSVGEQAFIIEIVPENWAERYPEKLGRRIIDHSSGDGDAFLTEEMAELALALFKELVENHINSLLAR